MGGQGHKHGFCHKLKKADLFRTEVNLLTSFSEYSGEKGRHPLIYYGSYLGFGLTCFMVILLLSYLSMLWSNMHLGKGDILKS